MIVTSGPYLYATELAQQGVEDQSEAVRALKGNARMVFYKEGITTTACVMEDIDGVRWLRVNGKNDASTFGDMPTQQLSGHLPMLLHPNPKKVLVIGLGSGVTFGRVIQYPDVEAECIEIAQSVVDAAHYFSDHNNQCLDDERAKIILADGRNHVALTDQKYDLISSQPSNPWMAGNASLFTVDFFKECREKLRPGGIMASWFHSYRMASSDFKMILNSFLQAFPEMTVWQTMRADYLLIGSDGPIRVDLQQLDARVKDERLAPHLAMVNIEDGADVFAYFLFGPRSLAQFCKGARANTDDRADLEFSSPRNMLSLFRPLGLGRAVSLKQDAREILVARERPAIRQLVEKVGRALEARLHTLAGLAGLDVDAEGQRQAIAEFEAALKLNPRDLIASWTLSWEHFEDGSAKLRKAATMGTGPEGRKAFLAAADKLRQAIRALPGHWRAHSDLGLAYAQLGEAEEAKKAYGTGLSLNPRDACTRMRLGVLYADTGDHKTAVKHFEQAILLNDRYIAPHFHLAVSCAELGDWRRAAAEFRKVLELNPDMEEARVMLVLVERNLAAGGSSGVME